MTRTMILLLMLVGSWLVGRYVTPYGDTQEAHQPPDLILCPITPNGSPCPRACSLPTIPAPLPWQVTPAGVDEWSGNPWGKGLK